MRIGNLRLGLVGILAWGCACNVNVSPPVDDGATLDEQLRAVLEEEGVLALVKPDVDSAKVALGRALFFDKLLSGNRNISCSTCHTPTAFTSDGLPLSKGEGGSGLGPARSAPIDENGLPILIPRNSPDVFNRADFTTMFWDGRVRQNDDGSLTTPAGDALLPGLDSALAAQALFPVTSGAEMRGSPGGNDLADIPGDDFRAIWSALMSRVLAIPEYRVLFEDAYPSVAVEDLTFAHAANAIAAFEIDHWTLDDSPFDKYLRGDNSAAPEAAKRGAILFYGKANCGECHSGTLLTDQDFHNRAIPQMGPGKGDGAGGTSDFGRERVTGDSADRYKFRTPPLRNVAATAPYMHDGAYVSLEDAVRHNLDPSGMSQRFDAEFLPQLPAEVQSVNRPEQIDDIIALASTDDEFESVELTDSEFADLMAFLEALTSPSLGELTLRDVPERVPSGLSLAD